MLSPSVWQKSTRAGGKYFRDQFRNHFVRDDYYRDKKGNATLAGELARELGLIDGQELTEEQFTALVEGRHPLTGARLGPRAKKEESRCSKDWTYSLPKSASLLAELGEPGIESALKAALVRGYLKGLRVAEREAACRDRSPGAKPDARRVTRNLAAVIFDPHDTARPVAGHMPDPDLHIHGLVLNLTKDPATGQILALDDNGMLRIRKIIEATMDAEITAEIVSLGYTIEADRGHWRVAEIDPRAEQLFSKRHYQIGASANARADEIEARTGRRPSLEQVKDIVAHEEREKKPRHLSRSDLVPDWRRQLREKGLREDAFASDSALRARTKAPVVKTARQAVAQAVAHLTEREAVVTEQSVVVSAIRFSLGSRITPDQMKREIDRQVKAKAILRSGDMLTTAEALEDEQRLIRDAKAGRGKVPPITREYHPNPKLSSEQAEAARTILFSRDATNILIGKAGTGKTTLVQEIVAEAEKAGKIVLTTAPTGRQAAGLRIDGFKNTMTLARMVTRPIPKGAMVILDEAGQVGTVDLLRLQNAVAVAGGRLLLVGDSGQHGSVARGDALRQLIRDSGVTCAELGTIRRQDESRARDDAERRYIAAYKEAATLASRGKAQASFDKVDSLGSVYQVTDPLAEAAQIARCKSREGSCMVVTQTRAAVVRLNEDIRRQRLADGLVAANGSKVTAYAPADLTLAERQDFAAYKPGTLVAFGQKHGDIMRGTLAEVTGLDTKRRQLILRDETGNNRRVGLTHAKKWKIVEKNVLEVSTGDQLLLRQNSTIGGEKTVANGEIVVVKSMSEDGAITLTDGRILPASYRHFSHGYASTSYSGQGRTVESVVIADSGSRAATSARQWYVDLSRGRRSVTVLTASKANFRAGIGRTGDAALGADIKWERQPSAREKLTVMAKKVGRTVADAALAGLRRSGLSPLLAGAQLSTKRTKAAEASRDQNVEKAKACSLSVPEMHGSLGDVNRTDSPVTGRERGLDLAR